MQSYLFKTIKPLLKSFFLLFFLSSLTGCTVWKPLRHSSDPSLKQLPDFYQHYYDYPRPSLEHVIISQEETDSYILKKIEFPLSLPPDLAFKDLEDFKKKVEAISINDKKTAGDLKLRYLNRVDYYLPKNLKPGDKRPVILISPILGGNMVVDHFAKYYAGRGYVAAIVYRKRTFWEDESDKKDTQQVEDYLRTSVIRLRQSLDWLQAQPEVDKDRIGAFGISYGAILHSVLAAVDSRGKYHVLAMPAAPLADVIMHCPDKAITKLVKHVHQNYGWTHEQIYQDLQKTIKTDPIYFASHIQKENVQIYVAAFDRVVGAGRSFGLWKAMGKPALKILPFGHYGGILVFPYLQTQSYLAFKKHLK